MQEEEFAKTFLSREGLSELIEVISLSHGNTLAVRLFYIMVSRIFSNSSIQYALTAMQNLMELEYGWSNLEDSFISTVVNVLSSPQSLINVCRPATAILKKLVEADPRSAPGPIMPSSSTRPPVAPPGMYTYYIDAFWCLQVYNCMTYVLFRKCIPLRV